MPGRGWCSLGWGVLSPLACALCWFLRNIWVPVYHAWSSAALMTQHTLPKSSLEDGEGDEEWKKVVFLPVT